MLRKLIPRNTTPRLVLGRRYNSKGSVPFLDDLTSSPRDVLENFPNLEGFYDMGAVEDGPANNADADLEAEYDFSELPVLDSNGQYSNDDILSSQAPMNGALNADPSSASLDQNIIHKFSENEINELQDMTNLSQLFGSSNVSPLISKISPDLLKQFKEKLHNNDTNPQRKPLNLIELSTQKAPITIISKFTDPYINLALEYFLFDNMPSDNNAHRLIFYKNKPCVVFGKNQNPFKEINFHYANLTKTPLLRRLSGGGTVVHDLGNLNFSFMAKQSKFDRTKFTNEFIQDLNLLVNNEQIFVDDKEVKLPQVSLGTLDKGDIINTDNQKKISGSAYKLAKNKFIHHGTMLMNSNLDMLRKLLKLTPERKQNIVAQGTDSIPSSVENYSMDEDLFMYSVTESFLESYGSSVDEVIVVDSYDQLPENVIQRANELTHWSWVFGKTPKFKHTLNYKDKLQVVFQVEKFEIKSVEVVCDDILLKSKFDRLSQAVSTESIRYIGTNVAGFIDDYEISQWISWEIDYDSKHENFGVDMDR